MKRTVVFLASVLTLISVCAEGPIDGLLDRIDSGLSRKMSVEIEPGAEDFFELSQRGDMPHITANNKVSAATGVHWYLKYHAGVMLTWDNMHVKLPDALPAIDGVERHTANVPMRYYLNYCTYSYSMPFWSRERWQEEIDWMALHGINMPLMLTGSAAVWRATLKAIGYPEYKTGEFIAGPAYQAWWLMNNLQGWGGPQSDAMYVRDGSLARFVVDGMKMLDIEPVLPGYSGMVPADAASTLGLNTADPGIWLGYTRPAFLQPTDSAFARIARVYYAEQQKIMGQGKMFAMDPFHEGGNTDGVDLPRAGRALLDAMRMSNPGSRWVIQAWQDNPRAPLIDSLHPGSVTVLDLFAESMPQCGDPSSPWFRPQGFGHHERIWCMLLNYGGNVGLHGKMRHIPHAYYTQLGDSLLKGVGLTMEGIENNPIMYELVSELPWRDSVDVDLWLAGYVRARYGRTTANVERAWQLLSRSIYNAPPANRQQGTTESPFCARPSDNPQTASSWAETEPYYNGYDVIEAARLMANDADDFAVNESFLYDLTDITRQALTEYGRMAAAQFHTAAETGDSAAYRMAANKFLDLILMQDSLLSTHSAFRLGHWTQAARRCGSTPEDKELYERNARTIISTWGGREAADRGGLHNYSHREWQGMLSDLYYPQWSRWFDARLASWGNEMPQIDWYDMERQWIESPVQYNETATGNVIHVARHMLYKAKELFADPVENID